MTVLYKFPPTAVSVSVPPIAYTDGGLNVPVTPTNRLPVELPAGGGGLTDTELRASPVPVSGPLTDTELRATAVPVSGPLTDTELRATPVPVSGPLTDTQLRDTPVPVSASALPLPSGAATESTLGDLLTELQLKADLSETQPVSAASLPLPSGAATEAKQDNLITAVQSVGNKQLIPVEFDEITITYVGSTTDIDTVVYEAGGSTVATLTMGYDGDGRLNSVVRS